MTEQETERGLFPRIRRFFRVATEVLKAVDEGPYGTLERRVRDLEDRLRRLEAQRAG